MLNSLNRLLLRLFFLFQALEGLKSNAKGDDSNYCIQILHSDIYSVGLNPAVCYQLIEMSHLSFSSSISLPLGLEVARPRVLFAFTPIPIFGSCEVT